MQCEDTGKPDGLQYNNCVELSPSGLYGQQDYANRGTLTLHSLYLLLWANFGTFCISLLTQQKAEEHLHGSILSKDIPIRNYCISQLQTVWLHIKNNLNISDEQRSCLVIQAMWNLYEVLIHNYCYCNLTDKTRGLMQI